MVAPRATAHLIGREQSAVGEPGTAVLEVHEAADLGLQAAAGLLEERAQRRVVREFGDAFPGKPRIPHIGDVGLERAHRGPL